MFLSIPETTCKDEEFHLLGWTSLLLNQKELLVFFQTLRIINVNENKIFCKSLEIAKVLGIITLMKSTSHISNILSKLDKFKLIDFKRRQVVTEDNDGNQKVQMFYEIKPTQFAISEVILNLRNEYHKKLQNEEKRRAYWDEQRRMEDERAYNEARKRETLEIKRNAEVLKASLNFSNFNHELNNIH